MAEPAVAVATLQGEVPGVVSGEAVGVPVVAVGKAVGVPVAAKMSSRSSELSDAGASSAADSSAVAVAFVYTPFLAKVFNDMDLNKNGLVEEDELTAALAKLGFQDLATLSSFDTNGDVRALRVEPAACAPRPRGFASTRVAGAARRAKSI
jgi:hypothetical protein